MRRGLLLFALLLIAGFAAGPAFGSAIIGRDVSHATLAIDRHGHAHVTYRVGGRTKVLTASGAINARASSRSVPQVELKIRYGQDGNGVCLQYDGPPLAWLLEACKAPDGSYWALQSWVRLKPNYGGTTGATELHLSHWRGPLAILTTVRAQMKLDRMSREVPLEASATAPERSSPAICSRWRCAACSPAT